MSDFCKEKLLWLSGWVNFVFLYIFVYLIAMPLVWLMGGEVQFKMTRVKDGEKDKQ